VIGQGFITSFRARVLAGLILIVPLWVTALVGMLLFRTLDGIVKPLVASLDRLPWFADRVEAGWRTTALEYTFVILLAVLVLYLLGLVSTTWLVRRLYGLGEKILLRIPLIKTIYMLTKQVLDLVSSRRGSSFKEVVAIEYPKEDCWALAFVTGQTRHSDEDRAFINVFLPTTPNPTSGFMLMVPRGAVKNLDLSVEEAVKMLMSGGAITPEVIRAGAFPGLKDAEGPKGAEKEKEKGAGGEIA
jgi:uncharacterized membrane protein